ncbi:MAG TPA: hypothetical protein VH120_09930 [Gemmataceae bacterium]|nr:hypothetical protein [Gemmataceae bacterium]
MPHAIALALLLAAGAPSPPTALLTGFHRSSYFGEQVHEQWIEGDVRVLMNLPADYDPARPTRLVIYATPNGSTIEQTLGCAPGPDVARQFDIQHVAAQVRRFRELRPMDNVVLACVQAEGQSWPGWRSGHGNAPAMARRIVDWLKALLPNTAIEVTLTGHSGGGAFTFATIDAAEAIPTDIDHIAFLDSNYSYDDKLKHGDKLLAWLRGTPDRRLSVVAYDDREITLNGKKVVGPAGGTFRGTERMLDRFRKAVEISESKAGDFVVYRGMEGRFTTLVHTNPRNVILHSMLVGQLFGLLGVLMDAKELPPDDESLVGPRANPRWVQPAPGIPPRPANSPGGRAFMKSIAALPRSAREEAIVTEICRGNIPDFLRSFRPITVTLTDQAGKEHTATYEVMPDYLAVGSDADFVRVPMTPQSAQRIADAFGCSLPTRKIVDDVYKKAAVKLEPMPLTKDREAVETFVGHNEMIEKQRAGKVLGSIVFGIKKDVVVTNRLGERPNRVAIYGWHKLDGQQIQPLSIAHVNWYVDYSHGIRLMKRTVTVDGKPRDVRAVLHAADLCGLLSDEGAVQFPAY